MDSFVDIQPVFSTNSSRSIEKLEEIYNDQETLKTVISRLLNEHLEPQMVKNKKILLKPNWVKHDTAAKSNICLRTNDNFLLATLEVVLSYKPANILIGDAPVQGCNWDKMLSNKIIDRVAFLSKKYNIPVKIKDFRRVTFEPLKNNPEFNHKPISDYVIFDLGKESHLEPISRNDKKLFRVTNYNPDRLAESHRPGVHKYCITKELFNADLIISLPKVKTHQKAGITAALKNIVGLNGDKDFLPHHRMGGTGFGGDCYPGKNLLRYCSELALDFANRRQGEFMYLLGSRVAGLLWKLSFPNKEHQLAAGWYGNDTTWRMVLDLNKIVLFGKADGTLVNKTQRRFYSLCDGIIGGQGNGPLSPEPLALGVVSFTNSSELNDLAMATLMGLEIHLIPILKEAHQLIKNAKTNVLWNKKLVNIAELSDYSIKTKLPPGWQNYSKGKDDAVSN